MAARAGKIKASENGHAATTLAFLRALWPDPPAGHLLLWVLEDKKSRWFASTDLPAVAEAAERLGRRGNVYLGCGLSGKEYGEYNRCPADKVVAIPGLWADVDVAGPPHKKDGLPPNVDSALSLANAMPPRPSVVVRSGYGLQCWWLFTEPWRFTDDADREAAASLVQQWQGRLRQLAEEHGWGLDATQDLARILRVPGTLNHKGVRPVPVTADLPAEVARYTVAAVRQALAIDAALVDELARFDHLFVLRASAGLSPADRATAYLAKYPPAVSSQRGHARTYYAARVVVRGFGLGVDEGLHLLLQHYNPRCRPPWTEKELRHKCEDAATKPFTKPVGWMLNEGDTQHANADGAPKAQQDGRAGGAYRFESVDSATFFGNVYTLEWLVSRVLVAGQPGVIGGPKKTLKTSTLVDLAVSLGSATPFLGKFAVRQRRRVVLISAESGEAVLQDAGRRVCQARDVDPSTLDVHWSFRLPQLASASDRQELRRGLADLGAEVVMIDPLYLALLSGVDAREVEVGNLYQMGPLLRGVAEACLQAKATPVLSHHSGKARSTHYNPLDLNDLSFSGIAEFARQWLLVNRREPFDPDTGSHKLWLSVGGSAGQAGCWVVDVEEGLLGEDFSGRKWDVRVLSMTEAQGGATDGKDQARKNKQARQLKEDGAAVLQAIDKLADAEGRAGYTPVRDKLAFSGDRMRRAVQALVDEGSVVEVPIEAQVGKGHKTAKAVKGLAMTSITDELSRFDTAFMPQDSESPGPTGQVPGCPDGPDDGGHREDQRDSTHPVEVCCPDGPDGPPGDGGGGGEERGP
jgi:replicative DNA helicase